MSSRSLTGWSTERAKLLNEIGSAFQSLNPNRGRRYATNLLSQAYAIMVYSQVEGYCRDLRSECVQHLVSRIQVPGVAPSNLRDLLEEEFLLNRRLDSGNPNPGNLGSDFNRLGANFWTDVIACDRKNIARKTSLEIPADRIELVERAPA